MERLEHSPSAGAETERRTLIVSYDPAFPAVSGADLRNFRNACLAAEYGPVRLASIMPLGDSSQPSDARIHAIGMTAKGEPRSASLGWWRFAGENRIPRTALVRLRALVQTFKPDTIIVEGTGLFRLLRPLRPLVRQLILDMHNIESDLTGQMRSPKSTRSGLALARKGLGMRRLERKALAIVDRVWACSKQDRNRLIAFSRPTVPIDIVPNGIPHAGDIPQRLPAEAATDSGFPVILFVGHLGYSPNIDAAERLAGIILPRIRQSLPAATLVLAGRSPTPAVRALAGLPGLQLIENPENVASLLSKAHLSIVPLKAGGGTRIKILEAMAWGVPVVATPLAAEGLELVENDEVLLSITDEGVADMAVGLCLDAERRARQRVHAHQAVWARYGPQAIREAVRAGLVMDNDGT
ncbi:glycosyltransferase family 4 protein [Mesorhizobium sp. dw_380]|uniref:glycosyltransferase family 4 protein n=1 Tax=Mesorhizobium sp. dw_380 TaxID=2812001 RepID=UPI001BDE9FD9|nr:glycosyltransferase family 4 protein [Mesorhizobium sp. dw_380]